jgi:hypothetical protein
MKDRVGREQLASTLAAQESERWWLSAVLAVARGEKNGE